MNKVQKMYDIGRHVLVFVGLLFSTNGLSIELVSKNATIFEQAVTGQTLMAGLELLLDDQDGQQQIAPTHQLKSGDHIRLRLQTSVDSQYRIYQMDPQGEQVKILLFEGQTIAAIATMVPSIQRGVFELDAKPGTEWLQLIVRGKNIDKRKSLTIDPQPPLKQHPHGKIEQIILRNIELLVPQSQKVQYDPLSQVIYFSLITPKVQSSDAMDEISLKLGLNHGE